METVILNSTGEGWHAEELVRALGVDRGASGDVDVDVCGNVGGVHVCCWADIEADVSGVENGGGGVGGGWARVGDILLDGVDAIVLRSMGMASLEQIVFRMDVMLRLECSGVYFVNSPRSIEASVDKYRASGLISDAGVAVPETRVCQRVDDAMRAFEELGGDVIVKPLFGSEGFGMMRVSDRGLASRAFSSIGQIGGVMYVQAFVDHLHGEGGDYRLFVVGDRVVAAMRRQGVGGPDGVDAWRANVARGGTVSGCAVQEMSQGWCVMAVRAAQACGANVAGVDVLVDCDGQAYVIEVNASPGWKALAGATGVDVAGCIADHVREMAGKRDGVVCGDAKRDDAVVTGTVGDG